MPEKPQEEKQTQNETKEIFQKKRENKSDGNWSEDQREKSYYYDDAHGYEIYNPDEEDDEDE